MAEVTIKVIAKWHTHGNKTYTVGQEFVGPDSLVAKNPDRLEKVAKAAPFKTGGAAAPKAAQKKEG